MLSKQERILSRMTTDPFDSADNAKPRPMNRTYFGQIFCDMYHAILVKGQGKVLFDQNQHSEDQKVTAINLTLNPLPGASKHFTIERSMIAESNEWAKITLPSLKALNISSRVLNGKFAQVELVPTGRTYVSKEDGQTKENTTFKFIAIYDTEQACRAANDAFWASRKAADEQPAQSAPPPEQTPSQSPLNEAEKKTAASFLLPLWNASGKDVNKFAQSLASNQLTSKYFTLNSPEVIAIVQGNS